MVQWFKTKIDESGRECTRCKQYKLRDAYLASKVHSSGYTPHCKKCAMVYGYSTRSYKCNQEAKQFAKKRWGVGKVTGFMIPKE